MILGCGSVFGMVLNTLKKDWVTRLAGLIMAPLRRLNDGVPPAIVTINITFPFFPMLLGTYQQ